MRAEVIYISSLLDQRLEKGACVLCVLWPFPEMALPPTSVIGRVGDVGSGVV